MDASASHKCDEELNSANLPGMVEITNSALPYYGGSAKPAIRFEVIAGCRQQSMEQAVSKFEDVRNISNVDMTKPVSSTDRDADVTVKLGVDESANPISCSLPRAEIVGDADAAAAEKKDPSEVSNAEVKTLPVVPDPVTGGGGAKAVQGAIKEQQPMVVQGSGVLSGRQNSAAKDRSASDSQERVTICLSTRMSSWGSFTRTVLIAIDASIHAKYAFEWYARNVWKIDDLLVLAHIPETPALRSISFKKGVSLPTDDWAKIIKQMNEKTIKLFEDYEAECAKKKIKYKLTGESFRNVGEGICQLAADEKADLIVVGRRGMSSVKRLVMGSVSEYVVRNAGMPCIVVQDKAGLS